MIWNREEYIAHMNFEFTGKEMFCELFGPLQRLEGEWRAAGVSEKEIGMTAFDWDYVLKTGLDSGANLWAITGIEPKVISDDGDCIISTDRYGRTVKMFRSTATIPLPLTHPVTDMDSWLKIKHWYEFSEDRINKEQLLKIKDLQSKGYLVIAKIPGGFDEPRQLLGEEALCYACYEQPELIEDILSTICDTAIKTFERALETVKVDCLSVHDDMAGKSGPLFGPNQINEFMKPYYSKVWELVKANGCTIFSQDSDGDMNAVVDNIMDCGINSIYPCEPEAGMDIVKLREKYGKTLSLKGGIDKYVLQKGKEDIKREIEYKMTGITRGGGTVFALDHRIPNGVSIDNYRFYINYSREILGLPPITNEGWERMAF